MKKYKHSAWEEHTLAVSFHQTTSIIYEYHGKKEIIRHIVSSSLSLLLRTHHLRGGGVAKERKMSNIVYNYSALFDK